MKAVKRFRASVEREIEHIESENQKQHLHINFYGLECHRSSCSPYGPSFLQVNRLLYLGLQPFLDANATFQSVGTAFLIEPPLLQERLRDSIFSHCALAC